ncbi:MAG: flagellar hook-basal body complex protein [Butyrivibrio sp.]|nr:flagellar hook-basal body complex protein [Butyrivibrio sp.]
MLRSMWSGVSGLKTHQMEMDVIGNNIANVNTTGYKSKAYTFKDTLYQTMSNAMGATDVKGSVSARQVGLGTRTGAIKTNISAQGSAMTTYRTLDLMINGDSFFTVQKDIGDPTTVAYTRDGNLDIDANGSLVTSSNGYYVLGWTGTETTGAIGRLDIVTDATKTLAGQATSVVTVSGNIDKNDTNISSDDGKVIKLEVYDAAGDTYTLKYSLTDGGDEDPTTYTLSLTDILDSNGDSMTVNTTVADISLVYDPSDGTLSTVNGGTGTTSALSVNFTDPDTNKSVTLGLTLDFSDTTNYNTKGSSTIKMTKGDVDGNNAGYPVGTMTGYSIANDGGIHIEYSNGQTRQLGTIATAIFSNSSGLSSIGDNLFQTTLNSGEAQYQKVDADGGYISSGTLEMSSVDLAMEFTNMITTQRGFQANSKVITTSDEMLQILKGLKR